MPKFIIYREIVKYEFVKVEAESEDFIRSNIDDIWDDNWSQVELSDRYWFTGEVEVEEIDG